MKHFGLGFTLEMAKSYGYSKYLHLTRASLSFCWARTISNEWNLRWSDTRPKLLPYSLTFFSNVGIRTGISIPRVIPYWTAVRTLYFSRKCYAFLPHHKFSIILVP